MASPSRLQLDSFLPYRISVAANRVSDVIAGAYRSQFGLTVPEWRLIAVLADRGQATQSELAVATSMDKLTVSRAAIALVARGLVDRNGNPRDKRSNLLSLSPTGAELHAHVAPKALSLERALLAGFTGEEREQLDAMLRRLEAAATRLARAPGAIGESAR